MLSTVLTEVISHTPEAMRNGSTWCWVLPLAPGVPERLVVGNERASLTWFYDDATGDGPPSGRTPSGEYLRTFSRREGVLGAMGVYRAAFTSIEQTEPLQQHKVRVPVVALGGELGLGDRVGQMAALVAEDVEAQVLPGCDHFVPEKRPDEVTRRILQLTGRTDT